MNSSRSKIITRRTYNRPKSDESFETWEETIERVIEHQKWLWERQIKKELNEKQKEELMMLKNVYMNRIGTPSGRTLWLGGTDISKKREATQFNCSGLKISTIHDCVDAYWNLLQGVGVGFKAEVGNLSGFSHKVKSFSIVKRELNEPYVKSENNDKNTSLLIENAGSKIYILEIGDSAEAWAKCVGKLLALKERVDHIVINTRKIRPAGTRLRGYGWISSGSTTLETALINICHILNNRIDSLLNEIDILDVMNHLGLTLSSRRSAEICLMDSTNIMADEFATIKKDHWINNPQRSQSNNSLMFWKKPTRPELKRIFKLMEDAGGSEPGFLNAEAAKKRAPYFSTFNPCAEICLADGGYCNLSTIDLSKLNDMSDEEVKNIFWLIGRANYRQTCVDLRDEILQKKWHENNEFLRLTGVNITGFVQWKHQNDAVKLQQLKKYAVDAVNSMAEELQLPKSKNVTTIQPSGTLSKILDCCEGVHKPLGRFIFNNVRFSKYDKIVEKLRNANYYIFDDPYSSDSVLVRLPVKYDNIEFNKTHDGKEINIESALTQLNRYKFVMENYVQHNCSVTISYDLTEVPDIIDWFMENWDCYVGVSFLYRNDPSKSAKDLGYPYLPQEVVTEDVFNEYVKTLLPFDLDKDEKYNTFEINVGGSMCINGVCPDK